MSPERSFGPYEILAPIGAGGMGEVFKARDRRLDRIVALKTAREQFTERFAREARAAAALNHPNIATLYDVGPDYLVMEYVEGEALQGPLPVARALVYARQVLDALEAAHRKGIIHCDLKPANILIAKSGVKLLDFGLAQVRQKLKFGDETATMSLTAGAIEGTLQYMAPEQLQGKPADARTDIFAFGLLLYEILTGRQAFQGDNAASVISAIMTAEPRTFHDTQFVAPAGLERMIQQCLAKDPDNRWQSAADIKHALDLLDLAPATPAAQEVRRTLSPNTIWWVAAAFAIGALATFAIARLTRPSAPAPWTFRPITYSGRAIAPAISPDGKQVAFFWFADGTHAGLYVQLVNGGNPLLLPLNQIRGRIAWSPDSSQIAFISDSGLAVMPALGGAPRRVAAIPQGSESANVAWSSSGAFFIVDTGWRKGLAVVAAEGGEFKPITKPLAASDYNPAISPDGRAVAFVRRTSTYNSAVFVMPLTQDGASRGQERMVTAGVWNIGSLDWTPDGSGIVFEGSGGNRTTLLWRVPLTGGEAVRLNLPSANAGSPSVARQSGRMVYVNGQYDIRVLKIALGGHAAGEPKVLIDAIGDHGDLSVTRDGSHVAFVSDRTGSKEVWTANADGSGQTQLTFFNGPAVGSPSWSPDNRQIVFDGYAGGSSDIYLVSAEGGKPARLTSDAGNEVRPTWSHDGQWVYYSWDRPGKRRGIWKVRASGGEPVQAAPEGNNAYETPDGKWLYFASPPKLWRMHPDGTERAEVSAILAGANEWNIGGHSVYLLAANSVDLLRAPFGSSTFETAYHFTESSHPDAAGTTIAMPGDESWAIYRKVTRSLETLTLIEGFR